MANDLQRRDNFFDDMMNMRDLFNDNFFPAMKTNYMKSDVTESDKGYQVKIDMPGFDKKDIHVNYANGMLTVSGHRETFDDDANKNGEVIQSERRYGQMSRSYRLPNVDLEKVNAKYNDGVLELDLPKISEKANGSHIEIQ
ncbi:Hsp20/alpha crystallin family protein [Limosilactobacillus secaliphilus]|uniref:Small heat shock protein n=1 Tax=Limosilactobacillus secaliphilus TaxID=396268 RepID=A0A0R2I1U5_9LACO|nr:Hsp20/alpha crystallin family protein [Limosilactobacillus secaliphilus]KRN59209.1 small heat shock protein [Limosilactobacillus secaliphilus]